MILHAKIRSVVLSALAQLTVGVRQGTILVPRHALRSATRRQAHAHEGSGAPGDRRSRCHHTDPAPHLPRCTFQTYTPLPEPTSMGAHTRRAIHLAHPARPVLVSGEAASGNRAHNVLHACRFLNLHTVPREGRHTPVSRAPAVRSSSLVRARARAKAFGRVCAEDMGRAFLFRRLGRSFLGGRPRKETRQDWGRDCRGAQRCRAGYLRACW